MVSTTEKMSQTGKQGLQRITAVFPKVDVLLQALGLFFLFSVLFAGIQFATPALAGNDGYYHMKMGYLIRQEGLTPIFDLLPHTILNEAEYYDHHLLYHVYLAIFAPVDPAVDGGLALTQGAKIASIILPSLAFLAIWWLLRAQRVPWPGLWSLTLFAISEAFLYRMSMPRAQSLALLLLALALHWLLTGRYWLLLPLGFIFVWAYNAFPLLLIVAGIYVVATLLLERKFAWQALVYPAAGIVLGLLINPYFSENIRFILGHLTPKLGGSETRVGNEWSAYRTDTLLRNSGLALAAVLAGAFALGWQKDRLAKNSLVALGLVALFGTMLFQSRRFVEYFPAFTLIFLAFSAAPLLRTWQSSYLTQRGYGRFLIPVAFFVFLLYPTAKTVIDARGLMADSRPADRYADAALWLNDHAEPDTVIFQTDWDDFTRLFFYSDGFIYTAGLDPTFMELHDPDLFAEWVDVTQGRVENPSAFIRDKFGAEFVFSDLNHDSFMDQAAADPGLEEVYRDDYAVILAVR